MTTHPRRELSDVDAVPGLDRTDLLIVAVLLSTAAFLFAYVPPRVSADLAEYLEYALNLQLGEGYVNREGVLGLFRGPVFPWTISLSFRLFGPSVASALRVVTFFGVMAPTVVYVFGRRLFGREVGLAAAFLYLSSPTVVAISSVHLDAIWPLPILGAALCLHEAARRESTLAAVCGGLALALSFLVKEAAVFFFPLPLFVLGWRHRRRMALLASYGALGLSLLPWALHLRSVTGTFLGMIGSDGSRMVDRAAATMGSEPVGDLFERALSLGSQAVSGYFWTNATAPIWSLSLWVPMLTALVLAAFRTFQGRRQPRICLMLVGLFVPIAFLSGLHSLRLGNSVLLLAVLFPMLAWALRDLLEAFLGRAWRPAFAALIGCLFVVQIAFDSGLRSSGPLVTGHPRLVHRAGLVYGALSGQRARPVLRGPFGSDLPELVSWVDAQNLGSDRLVADSEIMASALFFSSRGRLRPRVLPMLECRRGRRPEPPSLGGRPLLISANWQPVDDPSFSSLILMSSTLEALGAAPWILVSSGRFPELEGLVRDMTTASSPPPTLSGPRTSALSAFRIRARSEIWDEVQTLVSERLVLALHDSADPPGALFALQRDLRACTGQSLQSSQIFRGATPVDRGVRAP